MFSERSPFCTAGLHFTKQSKIFGQIARLATSSILPQAQSKLSIATDTGAGARWVHKQPFAAAANGCLWTKEQPALVAEAACHALDQIIRTENGGGHSGHPDRKYDGTHRDRISCARVAFSSHTERFSSFRRFDGAVPEPTRGAVPVRARDPIRNRSSLPRSDAGLASARCALQREIFLHTVFLVERG